MQKKIKFAENIYKAMIKNLLLLLYFSFFCTTLVFGQNIVLKDLADENVSNDTIFHLGNTNDNLLELGLKVINSGTAAIDIKVKKEEIVIVDGTENYFCWKECYTPEVFTSPDFITIEAGATNDRSFKGDYKPNQNNGESKIRYTFFNVADEQDTATVLVVYKVSPPTAINFTENNKNYISKPYPIPANNYVIINYDLQKTTGIKLVIFNLQGIKVDEKHTMQAKGKFVLLSDNYKQGIYLYQFTQNGKLVDSGKIIFQ
ncbi:MAG: hypothetical protein B6I20_12390 [Bacteroidetes bacterium 4572_117]|nr:MAG: hypothetical protein B6I20_12390 [Bacteroidetes bacterium 4572_117]